jgi:hypothetical protein
MSRSRHRRSRADDRTERECQGVLTGPPSARGSQRGAVPVGACEVTAVRGEQEREALGVAESQVTPGITPFSSRERLDGPGAIPAYVYVASSWRNSVQQQVVAALRDAGIDCYDFKNPESGTGFSWKEVKAGSTPGIAAKGSDWETAQDYLQMVAHPRAIEGFDADFAAMVRADTFVMVLPCGKSAHLELGWAIGAGKRTAILLEDPIEPELMYRAADYLAPSLPDLLRWLAALSAVPGGGQGSDEEGEWEYAVTRRNRQNLMLTDDPVGAVAWVKQIEPAFEPQALRRRVAGPWLPVAAVPALPEAETP